ncbi:class I SAM-dependent methyltransferase [Paenibacillus oenotherae]|nr:methyltransferase domain-containing protein [Paenibacillus oenotherae]
MRGYEQIGVAMTCRSFDEYVNMFDLTAEEELQSGPILDIAAGGSSFTASARERGYEATAVDPRYALESIQWIEEARAEIATSTAKLERIKDNFDWTYYGDLSRHQAGREASHQRFAAHIGTAEGRSHYKEGSLPELPFEDGQFSLVLCSHFLFLYGEQFDYGFHEAALLEMMRVCRPGGVIRVYPIMTLQWERYPHLDRVMESIRSHGGTAELYASKLPFIPGADAGLVIRR